MLWMGRWIRRCNGGFTGRENAMASFPFETHFSPVLNDVWKWKDISCLTHFQRWWYTIFPTHFFSFLTRRTDSTVRGPTLSSQCVLVCANILRLIQSPSHGDMLRAWVFYEACGSLNQKKCLSLVLFSLKTAFWWFLFFFLLQTRLKSIEHSLYLICFN